MAVNLETHRGLRFDPGQDVGANDRTGSMKLNDVDGSLHEYGWRSSPPNTADKHNVVISSLSDY